MISDFMPPVLMSTIDGMFEYYILLALPSVFAFLIGSIPFGVVVGRLFYASDLRNEGSGNIGAANALRTYGMTGAALVLVLDALKGFIPASFGAQFFAYAAGLEGFDLVGVGPVVDLSAAYALFAVLGHCYSPWLGFRGGKGVATFLGMLFGLSWISGLMFVAIWLAVVIPTRFASLGSMIASLVTPIVLWFLSHDIVLSILVTLAALLIVWKHRENITRLREGRENKITFGKASA